MEIELPKHITRRITRRMTINPHLGKAVVLVLFVVFGLILLFKGCISIVSSFKGVIQT
jgi:hypothetical protein